MRTRLTALAVVPLLVLATACAGSDEDGGAARNDEVATSLDGVEIDGDFGSAPTITVEDFSVEEQVNAVLSEGDGPTVDPERQTLLDLALVKGSDGDPIASTWEVEQPLTIGPDAALIGDLATAINEAIDGTTRGSRVAFAAPAGDVVGAEALTQFNLTATDTVVAVLDVLSVQPDSPVAGPEGEAVKPPAGTPGVVEKDGVVTGFDWTGVGAKPTKVQVIPLVEGTGPAITEGRLVQFDYFGEVFKGKEPFDESYTGDPITFPVGARSLIQAWDEGLIGVTEGSRVLIIAPPDAAYGDREQAGIPANSTLVFVLDVLDVDG
ncbi:MAG TPA: FKBP-type peptidyl-prolyl cis-trans isomerase [Nocardioidaceae bacterium]|nr:FKBP-type peptidyl-prolyl cis-trans isomerase [Nocardioidaceae bacterium]